jgi:hypothetical protein
LIGGAEREFLASARVLDLCPPVTASASLERWRFPSSQLALCGSVESLAPGLQVRALPGANQVSEPIYWRFRLSEFEAKKCGIATVLPLLLPTYLALSRKMAILFKLTVAANVKESAHDDINADHENSRNRNH